MKKDIDFLSEDELKKVDPDVLSDYLVTLESIECGLDEIINEKKEEEVNENGK